MATVQERLKLKRAPTDIWNTREQLCLASSVLKSGDQNWMSVSRSLKPIADKDSKRPPDWFSQKSCAQQYAYLLENADIPKRKKRESGETTSESIVRRLTQDRINEISNTLNNQREEYLQLKSELSLLKNGTISDEKLKKIWLTIEQDEKEQEQKSKTQGEWSTKFQQSKEQQPLQTVNVQNIQKKNSSNVTQTQEVPEIKTEDEDKKNKNGRSSLLTSLLKSPSPTTQAQTPTQAAGSPTIASLLCSSPKVPGPVVIQSGSPQLNQLVSNVIPNAGQERPSVAAPTLSMLLEQPSATAQRNLQLQNASTSISPKNLQNSTQVVNSMQTRSNRSINQGNVGQITQVQSAITNSNLSSTEIPQMISNPIDEVMPKVIALDKDEMNEMMGDIEEIIKEEITSSPQMLDVSSTKMEVADSSNAQMTTSIVTERQEPRNVDEAVSLSNSPTSEISIEEIDSSTSNIAEIIGTSIRTVELKANAADLQQEIKVENIDSKLSEENKDTIEHQVSQDIQESTSKIVNEIDPLPKNTDVLIENQPPIAQENIHENDNNTNKVFSTNTTNCDETKAQSDLCEKSILTKDSIIETEKNISKIDNISKEMKELDELSLHSENENIVDNSNITENKSLERNVTISKSSEPEKDFEQKAESSKSVSEIVTNIVKDVEILAECKSKGQKSENVNNMDVKNSKEVIEEVTTKSEEENNEVIENISTEPSEAVNNVKSNNSTQDNSIIPNIEMVIKKEIIDEVADNADIKETEYFKDDTIKIKIEPKKEDCEDNEDDCKKEKVDVIKKESNIDTLKKGNLEFVASVDDLDEEESSLSKLSGGRAMKTYSKKQNTAVDSEPENETSGETADYRAWKKSIMLVYNRLSTNRYASIFLRPITEDQAPGYHSIIFRPMDLHTIKKNIDNGTIRSTTHFQRDVMLMLQNAIMFNKHNTRIHKMTLEMQEESLQHMQVLVQATGEGSFRRETRTAASNSNEMADSSLKRKWAHLTSSPHELESPRIKKRRKSEND